MLSLSGAVKCSTITGFMCIIYSGCTLAELISDLLYKNKQTYLFNETIPPAPPIFQCLPHPPRIRIVAHALKTVCFAFPFLLVASWHSLL